jgi:hypothetical protein
MQMRNYSRTFRLRAPAATIRPCGNFATINKEFRIRGKRRDGPLIGAALFAVTLFGCAAQRVPPLAVLPGSA